MRRRTTTWLVTVAITSLIVLGGCTGFPGGEAARTSTPDSVESTSATSQRSSPTATPTSTATLPPDADPSRVVNYENLSESRRRVLQDALDGTVAFGPNTSYTEVDYDGALVEVFRRHDHVRYDGQLHRIDVDPTGYYVSYTVEFDATVSEPEGTVTAFENMSNRYREIVSGAIPDGAYRGRYTVPFGRWGSRPPPTFTSGSYLRYQNRTYVVSTVRREIIGYRLRIEEPE